MRKLQWIAAALCSAAVFIAITYTASWLLLPLRPDNGANWRTYRQEPSNSVDVLFFGSSLAYCDIAPNVIWSQSGITSYVVAGPEQTVPITQFYIREACRTQTPKVIGLELTSMFFSRYCNFTKANILYMPWSGNRLAATAVGAEPEVLVSVLFPLYDNHSRWTTITEEELDAHFAPEQDPLAGYTWLEDSVPQTKFTERDVRVQDKNYARNLAVLRQIARFCQQKNIQLLLFTNPCKEQIPADVMQMLRADVTSLDGVIFTDFNEDISKLSIDDETDWMDSLHFNCRGAEKFSRFLADYLTQSLALTPSADEDIELWQNRADDFYARLRRLPVT